MDSEILLLGLENPPVISSFTLDQAYPNPFNPITNIGYELPKESFVNITIYDIIGNEIKNTNVKLYGEKPNTAITPSKKGAK